MGTWDTSIKSSDSFLDIYETFFHLYNQGLDPVDISKQIQKNFADNFTDYEDGNNSFFGLALAQWETKSLDPTIFNKVKSIIDNGDDIRLWTDLAANSKTLKKRQAALDSFLAKISSSKEKPKRRIKIKLDHKANSLVKIVAPDGKKVFEASEFYENNVYINTGSLMMWSSGGGSVFYYIDQGKFVTARWLDSQTLEVTHDKDIVFTKKESNAFFSGDNVKVIYKTSEA